MRLTKVCGAAFALGILAQAADAQVNRYEIHPFMSVTMTDHEFLTGEATGTPVMLAGELRIPTGGSDRLPAMIILQGSAGLNGTAGIADTAANELNKLGIAAFIVDSFAGRGLTSTVNNQSLLGRLAMINDAYRALELLAGHPRIDATRIGVVGYSRGAGSSVFAAMDRFFEMHGPQNGLEFAAYVGFYTPCGTRLIDWTSVADKPILLLHGEADDWNPIASCREYVEELREAGADATLIAYPNAGHVFDAPSRTPATLAQAQTARNCQLGETPDHQIVNIATGQMFDWNTDPCVELGTNVAYVEAASRQAYLDLGTFLRSVFGLP